MHLRFASKHERLQQQPRGASEDLPPEFARLLEDVGPEWLDMPPASSSQRAACRIARRVSAVTGTAPSSSNQPTAAASGGSSSGTG